MTDPPTYPDRRRSGRLKLLLGGALAVGIGVASASILPGSASAATQVCSNQTGTNGMYYSMFVSGGSACITLNGSSYSSTWSGIGDFVGGIGWNPGSTSRSVSFNGSLSSSGGTALVSLYGWSTNPLVEYYVIEDDQGGSPSLGTQVGTVTSDGATYNLYEHQQVNQPSIQGTATFEQYLAIRQGNTTSGTITFGNFVNAWASHGMNLGTMNYQIMATEAFGGGSGSSCVALGGSCSSSGGGGSTGGGGTSNGCTATVTNGSSGSNWYNLNVSVSGSNSWTVTVNMVSPAVVYSTWNVTATFPSQYVMTAKPNGNGNNWGFTVSPNGQWTHPTVSCSTG